MTARAGRDAAAGGGFRAEATRALRATGLEGGYVRCVFCDGQLVLTGEEGGWLRLSLAQVATLRLGCRQTPFGPQYEARVRRADARAPLVLRPLAEGDHAAYAQVLRAAAWALARAYGTARVEAGLTRGEALFGPLAMIPAALALAWVALFVAEDIPLLLRRLIPLPALLLCVLLVRRANRRQYPRPIRSADDLDGQLPPGRGWSPRPGRGQRAPGTPIPFRNLPGRAVQGGTGRSAGVDGDDFRQPVARRRDGIVGDAGPIHRATRCPLARSAPGLPLRFLAAASVAAFSFTTGQSRYTFPCVHPVPERE